MDKREYLRSKGYTVGSRGRFSLEMIEELKDFVDNRPVLVKEKPQQATKPAAIPNQTIQREDTVIYIVHDGIKLAIGQCFECHCHIRYCKCLNGPRPPKAFR